MSEEKQCVLCKSVDGKLVIVEKRGVQTLISSSVERGEPDPNRFIVGVMVHENCRKDYVSKSIQQFYRRQLKASSW